MRIFQVAVTVLLICILFVGVVLYSGAQADIAYSVQEEPASGYSSMFNNMKSSIEEGTANKLLSDEHPERIEDYDLAVITVTVKNNGRLPMEWLTCEYMGAEGDIAVYDVVGLPADIPAGGEINFRIQLLRKSGAGATGPLKLNYYVVGNSITRTYK